jgi:large subunit ribosomal protein L15
MPLIRRLPKRGFNNAAFKKEYAIVNLVDLNRFKDGTTINESILLEANLIRGKYHGVKILGDGELSKKLTISVDKVSATAREKIEKAGGAVTAK